MSSASSTVGSSEPATPPTPSLDDMLVNAVAMVPELVDRSTEIDQLGSMPQDIAERMAGHGFYRLCSPVEAGGVGAGPGGMCRVDEILATGNGSAAWCSFISSTAHLNAAGSTETFRSELMAQPNLLVSGVFAASGRAVATERDGEPGYVVNGHWRWGSGCRNSQYLSVGVLEVGTDGAQIESSRLNSLWLTLDEIEIIDNWHVSGLRGTGSSDYTATDVWVPADRVITSARHSPFADDPVFRFPLFGSLASPIGAISLGMAQASVDEVIGVAKTKTPTGSRRTLAERPTVHRDLAIAATQLGAARSHFYTTIDELWAKACAGPTDLDDRVAVRAAIYHAVQTAKDVIDRMYSIVGGSSVFESSCLQRHFRDVHVATQHMMVGDSIMELAGRVIVGLDDKGVGL